MAKGGPLSAAAAVAVTTFAIDVAVAAAASNCVSNAAQLVAVIVSLFALLNVAAASISIVVAAAVFSISIVVAAAAPDFHLPGAITLIVSHTETHFEGGRGFFSLQKHYWSGWSNVVAPFVATFCSECNTI